MGVRRPRCKESYITSWFKQLLALLRPVNPSLQLRRPTLHSPTTTPYHHCRSFGLGLCRSHQLHQSVRVHSWLSFQIQHLVLPILTAATYTVPFLRAILFFTFQPPPQALLLLLFLLAAPPPSSSTTYPHGGSLVPRRLVPHFTTTSGLPQPLPILYHGVSLHCHQRTLPPRHLVFHFPTSSGTLTFGSARRSSAP